LSKTFPILLSVLLTNKSDVTIIMAIPSGIPIGRGNFTWRILV
jgi:hypothetical protein